MSPVIDTNVIIHGQPNSLDGELITIREVKKEIKSNSATLKLEALNLTIYSPSEKNLEKVKNKSEKINSTTSLTDEKLVALALDKHEKIVSDDKSLQNLASLLDVSFSGFAEESISEEIEWRQICSLCGHKVSSNTCPNCGSSDLCYKQH